MTKITHSPVTQISHEERAWILGKLWYQQPQRTKLRPLEPRASLTIEDDLPLEWDRQHSCLHGSERPTAPTEALDGFTLAVLAAAACVALAMSYVFVCGCVAVAEQVWRLL